MLSAVCAFRIQDELEPAYTRDDRLRATSQLIDCCPFGARISSLIVRPELDFAWYFAEKLILVGRGYTAAESVESPVQRICGDYEVGSAGSRHHLPLSALSQRSRARVLM